MSGIVGWAVERSRMILAMVALSIAAGYAAYTVLPREGSPNIDIPVLYVSVPLPGVSASDAERLMVRPLESKLRSVEGLKEMTSFATDNHAAVLMEFDFEWDKPGTIADVRDKVDQAKAEMPAEIEEPQVIEVNLSAFPILVVSLSGDVPERTLLRVAKDMQREVESLSMVLEAGLAGYREEMLEVIIDPLKMEAYNITAQELLAVVSNNNALVAAGAVQNGAGEFSVKLPGSFETANELYRLPVRIEGDRVVNLGDIATIRRTYEDRTGSARYNSEKTVALQVKKRVGENIIETVSAVRDKVAEVQADWPDTLKSTMHVSFSMDESVQVEGMVRQLESSVLTAVLLVMVVVVLTLGLRSSLLVGIAIPCSFLLSFALLAVLGMSVNNMVMFGLILAVGMLVDGAIVVAEYADRRLKEGAAPNVAYKEAAKRMFWPIVSSTATTLCAFLPMLFWPGITGKFMGQLPITLIFVLSASLVVALIFLPVLGSVFARIFAFFGRLIRGAMKRVGLLWVYRKVTFWRNGQDEVIGAEYKRTPFGLLISLIVNNPVMPVVAILGAFAAMGLTIFVYMGNNYGSEFFVKTDPERAVIHVRARGNMSLSEKDRLVHAVEQQVLGVDGVESVFAFAGEGGLEKQGGSGPTDSIGEIQLEFKSWEDRRSGDAIVAELEERIATVPGVIPELEIEANGPEQGKPVQLRLQSNDFDLLRATAKEVERQFRNIDGLVKIDDTLPLPGIDWSIAVDREMAGRFGADITTIGTLVQLVTRGALLDTIRPDDTDDELEIRVRFPEQDRLLTTLEQLKLRTNSGLVPLSNFIEISPVASLGQINRFETVRYVDVRADVAPGVNANQKIAEITAYLDENPLPRGVSYTFYGDQEEQAESMAFLGKAMVGALGLMFAILLAQFNSIYNSLLVLLAVVMSSTGVLLGMMVMQQPFSAIMTGTGVVALAGIVVNNNIVLIDTYREFCETMPRLEAIIRTAEQRIRPVLLTTITTMVGLMPMMFATSINFAGAGEAFGALLGGAIFTSAGWSAFFAASLSVGAPTALWWTQLATAVVFGLGVATLLTLLMTPAALALRVWIMEGAFGRLGMLNRFAVYVLSRRKGERLRQEAHIHASLKGRKAPEIDWLQEPASPLAIDAEGPLPTPAQLLPPKRPYVDAAE